MSYSVGFVPAVVEGARFCPGEFLMRQHGATPVCYPACPPTWRVYKEGKDDVCEEPSDRPTLVEGCPSEFMVTDNEAAVQWCAGSCPAGWQRSERDGIQHCQGPPGAPPAPQLPSRPTPARPPAPADAADPSRAGVDVALPWWAYAAGGALVLGAAAYYAWG